MAATHTPELFSNRFDFHAQEMCLVAKSFPFEEIQYRMNAPDLAAEVAGDLVGVAALLLVLPQYFQERAILVGERREANAEGQARGLGDRVERVAALSVGIIQDRDDAPIEQPVEPMAHPAERIAGSIAQLTVSWPNEGVGALGPTIGGTEAEQRLEHDAHFSGPFFNGRDRGDGDH